MLNYINFFKYGGIHINPKNKGKFTKTKEKTGNLWSDAPSTVTKSNLEMTDKK